MELIWTLCQPHGRPRVCSGTVYPKKYAHSFCFAVLCCGYTLTDFPISIRLTSLALWQSNDCPSASKATLMNMDKYLMWINYERLHNHNKAKHNKTVCIFLGIYCNSRGIYSSARNAWSACMDPAHGLLSGSVCRNCVVLFTALVGPLRLHAGAPQRSLTKRCICGTCRNRERWLVMQYL